MSSPTAGSGPAVACGIVQKSSFHTTRSQRVMPSQSDVLLSRWMLLRRSVAAHPAAHCSGMETRQGLMVRKCYEVTRMRARRACATESC